MQQGTIINTDGMSKEKQEAFDLTAASISNQYYAIYHVWVKTETFVCFREEVSKTRQILGEEGNYTRAWNAYVQNFITPEYQVSVEEFGNISTLAARLQDTDSISLIAKRRILGWIRIQFLVAKRDQDGNAENLVLTVKNVNNEVQLETQKKKAEFEAEHDPLTGMLNRKAFERISFSEEFQNEKTGFALIDIDNFKALNDCHGHDVGDQVLIAVSDILSQVFRDEDQLFRFGGDELAILLYRCDERVWSVVCKKFRDVHALLKKEFSEGLNIDVTISVGLTFSDTGYDEMMQTLADEALYETKRNGRAGCTLIDREHHILQSWRDKEVSIHADNSLEYAASGMYRIELSPEQKFPSRLICGEAIKLAFGVPGNATPEECYLIWKKGVDPEYASAIEETMRAMLEVGQSECTYKWIHPKWGKIYVRSNGFAEKKDGCMSFIGYHHILKDTRLIERRDERKMMLESLFHNLPGGIAMYRWNGKQLKALYISSYFEKEYGISNREDNREEGYQYVHPDDMEDCQTAVLEALKEKHVLHYDFRVWSPKQNCYCWVHIDAVGEDQKDGTILVYAMYTDVTQQKELVHQLKKSHESMEAALTASNLHSYEYDPVAHTGICFTETNYFGLPKYIENYPDSLRDIDLFHPEDAETFIRTAHQMDTGLEKTKCDVRIRKDGEYHWYSCMFDAYYDPAKEHNIAILTVVDIEDRMTSIQDYNERVKHLGLVKEDSLSCGYINLNRDTYDCICIEEGVDTYLTDGIGFEQLMMDTAEAVVGEETRKKYKELFSLKNMIKMAEEGQMKVQMEYLFRYNEKHTQWLEAVVDMVKNPITGEIGGVVYSRSIQNERLASLVLKKTMDPFYPQVIVVMPETDEYYFYNYISGSYHEAKDDFWNHLYQELQIYSDQITEQQIKEQISKKIVLEHLEEHSEFSFVFESKRNGILKRAQLTFIYMDDTPDLLLGYIRDITDVTLIEKLKHDSEHDPLTDLYNRKTTFRKSRELMDAHPGEQFVIVHIDIKHFRLYNTFFGDDAGDQLLCDVADQLRLIEKDYDHMVYGRIEADVFCACFVYDQKMYQKNLRLSLEYFKNYRMDFLIEPKVGLYFVTDKNIPVEAMFTRATLAAKDVHSNSPYATFVYDEELEEKLNERQQIINEMQMAIDQEQFQVYLQPKYSLQSNQMVGAEALVRWIHPEKGMISPGLFIPVFESNGFITTLDRYMWEHVCRILSGWKKEGKQMVPISVNVSRISMFGSTTVEFLKELIEKYEIDTEYLELELTESAYIDDPEEMKQQMHALKDAGFTILLDDFGSGYSSLNTLREIPVDVLKMDMKFLSLDQTDLRGGLVISSIVRMAKLLKLVVIAEGVELQEQADYLKEVGCEYVQGFLFSRPVPVAEFEKLLICGNKPLQHVNQSAIDHIGRILAETGSGTYAMGTVIPTPLACFDYSKHQFSFLRANPDFYTEFNLTDEAKPASEIFKEHLDEKTYQRILSAVETSIQTGKKVRMAFTWHEKNGEQRSYMCSIAYEGNIGESATIVVVYMNTTLGNC